MYSAIKNIQNIAGEKGEKDGYQHFLLFSPITYSKAIFSFNPLPDDKILGLPKLKAFAEDKLNITQNIKDVFHRIENVVGKEENASCQQFLLFPQCSKKAFFFLQCVISRHFVVKG